MKKPAAIWSVVKESVSAWSDDKGSILSAALSYYTIFSIAPLLLIAISVSGMIFGTDASRGQIFQALAGLIGETGASAIQGMVAAAASKPATNIWTTVAGVVTLLIGASGVFIQLQDSLDIIWKVKPKPGASLRTMLRQRFLSFAMVAGIAFLLLVSLLASAALSALGKFLSSSLPGGETLWQVINFGLSFAVTAFLFAMIYKVLPDVKLKWRDVALGAAVTTVLFDIGQTLIGLYIGKSGVASSYGAAGSLVVLLVWFFYSSAILFMGAEFTRTYTRRFGSGPIVPKAHAEAIHSNVLQHPGPDREERRARLGVNK